MKKIIALAVAAIAASGANASWQNGLSSNNNEAGELLLTMWNTEGKSFVQDLNVYTSDIFYRTGSFDNVPFTVSSVGLNFLGSNSPISWTVAGANTDKTTSEFDRNNFPANSWRNNRGSVFTAVTAPVTEVNPVVESARFNALQEVTNRMNNLADNSADSDVYLLEGVSNFGNGGVWGAGYRNWGALFEFGSGAVVGDGTIGMFGLQYIDDRSDVAGGDDTYHSVAFGDWTLTGDQLTYVEEVPVPAAVWLFGSALVGLAGVGRNRKVSK